MKTDLKLIFVCCLLLLFSKAFSQSEKIPAGTGIVLDSNKVKIFEKYLRFNHSTEPGGYESWKANNPSLFQKEMWYYSESFYIVRDSLPNGITMNEGMIYVPRFENQRNMTQEVMVTFPGFKDVMMLLPGNKLIYKPK